jgi:hypothetical protein
MGQPAPDMAMEPKPDEFVNLLSWGWEKNVMEHFAPAVMMSASHNFRL